MAYHQLTQHERYLISRCKARGWSMRQTADFLGRSPGTISRELSRNSISGDGVYRTDRAQSNASARRRKCRRGSQFSEAVLQDVEAALRERLSPEQIVGQFTNEGKVVPSHETIYRHISIRPTQHILELRPCRSDSDRI